MRNITVSVNDETYHEIRVWSAQCRTSISRVVQSFLEELPRIDQARQFPVAGPQGGHAQVGSASPRSSLRAYIRHRETQTALRSQLQPAPPTPSFNPTETVKRIFDQVGLEFPGI